MCGIFALIQSESITSLPTEATRIKNRGPDNTTEWIYENIGFMFHRLAVHDKSTEANQPFHFNGLHLMCNGEVYNGFSLRDLEPTVQFQSNSDCEILPHIFNKYGIEQALNILDGVFAMTMYDSHNKLMVVARDPYGIRPLFYGISYDNNGIIFASEHKAIPPNYHVRVFPPSSYCVIDTTADYYDEPSFLKYHAFPKLGADKDLSYDMSCERVRIQLTNAVRKRIHGDRPIGFLLSGGLDSSLVCAIASKLSKTKLRTFSIGLKNSPDLLSAKQVADYLGTDHTEIIVKTNEALSVIDDVIQTIESYDVTTIRASIWNYLAARYVSTHTDIKILLNGDGADEVCGGYKYLHDAPDLEAWSDECTKLLTDIHYFDVLRSDRCVASKWTLEARSPFLDKSFVDGYLRIPVEYRSSMKQPLSKMLLRDAFRNYLPDNILYRPKEAFSDGISTSKNSWHVIIREHLKSHVSDEQFHMYTTMYHHNTPDTREAMYYRIIFETFYKGRSGLIPYIWRPRWTTITDPSARDLIFKIESSTKCKLD